VSQYHAKGLDPFQALVKAKADPKKLCRLLAYVRVGAALEAGRRPKEGTRKAQLRRAKEARLKRTPRRLREFADEIERDLFSNPEFDPRRLLPPSENKMCLKEAIAKAEKYSDVRALVSEWVNLPKSLYSLAKYLEIRLGSLPQTGRLIRPVRLVGEQ